MQIIQIPRKIRIYHHSSIVPGFLSNFLIVPELNLAGAILTDTNDILFMPSLHLVIYIPYILIGDNDEFPDRYIVCNEFFDIFSFGFMVLGLALIILKTRKIIKKMKDN